MSTPHNKKTVDLPSAFPKSRSTPTLKSHPSLTLPRWQRPRTRISKTTYNLRPSKAPNYRGNAARYLLAQHIFNTYQANHIYDASGKKLSIDNLLNG